MYFFYKKIAFLTVNSTRLNKLVFLNKYGKKQQQYMNIFLKKNQDNLEKKYFFQNRTAI
jgi:hypothetical protein